MKLITIILLLSFTLTGCFNKKDLEYNILIEKYEGFGVIKFSNNSLGSIRYLEFYPLIIENEKNFNFEELNKFDIKNGIILRLTNSSMLWQTLVAEKNIKLNKEGYGFAIILIKYHMKINDNKYINVFDSYLFLRDHKIKVKMLDPESNKIEIDNFKIIKRI